MLTTILLTWSLLVLSDSSLPLESADEPSSDGKDQLSAECESKEQDTDFLAENFSALLFQPELSSTASSSSQYESTCQAELNTCVSQCVSSPFPFCVETCAIRYNACIAFGPNGCVTTWDQPICPRGCGGFCWADGAF